MIGSQQTPPAGTAIGSPGPGSAPVAPAPAPLTPSPAAASTSAQNTPPKSTTVAPTAGRIVFVRFGEQPWPAIVAKVNSDGTLNAHIFTDNAVRHSNQVKEATSDPISGDGWYWPTRD